MNLNVPKGESPVCAGSCL